MSKLYQTLEQVFQMRINSNNEIIPYIKKLAEMGKFDEPKKIAAIAILLDRVAKLEDEADMENSLSDIATLSTDNPPSTPQETIPEPSSEVVAIPEGQEMPQIPSDGSLNPSSEANPSTFSTPDEEVSAPPVQEFQPSEPTVSEFTPESITDPQTPPTNPDSTTTA